MRSTNDPRYPDDIESAVESIWDESPKTQPIEVWLSQRNFEVTGRVVYESERTDHLRIESLSMRGAQREVTGFLIEQGYAPAGRWEIEPVRDGDQETSRRFRPDDASPHQLTPKNEVERSGGPSPAPLTEKGEFFVYENWTNTFALVHRGSCSFCNHGRGMQGRGSKTPNGQWHGSFPTLGEALAAARQAAEQHPNASVWTVRTCGSCLRDKAPQPVRKAPARREPTADLMKRFEDIA